MTYERQSRVERIRPWHSAFHTPGSDAHRGWCTWRAEPDAHWERARWSVLFVRPEAGPSWWAACNECRRDAETYLEI